MGTLGALIADASAPISGASIKVVLFARDASRGESLVVGLEAEADLKVDRVHPDEVEIRIDGRAWLNLEAACDVAAQIRVALDLEHCEPDVALGVMPSDEFDSDGRRLESVDGLTKGCWAAEEKNLDSRKRWAIELIRADRAWAFADQRKRPSRGLGIVIAQPDTGITRHPELRDVPIRMPHNLLGDGPADDATDPLAEGGNPGHGTATSSVAVSRSALDVVGSAPLAALMPIRAIQSVIVVSQVNVACAIDHAVDNGAHVVTMSLGGIWSFALWRAIERAVAADVIVMAAAGNCIKTVVWPARFENCLAVAGVDQHRKPWIGSCRGPEIDISAPAQNVYCATAGTTRVRQGQGTSFAVALVSGAAACWLAFHGRAGVIGEARRRGETLQGMFRRLVQATAARPDDWDEFSMGPGVLDVQALLKAPFDLGRETEGPIRPPRPNDPFFSLHTLALEKRPESDGHVQIDRDRAVKASASFLSEGQIGASTMDLGSLPAPALRPLIDVFADPARERSLILRNQIASSHRLAEGATLESVQRLESSGQLDFPPPAIAKVIERVRSRAAVAAARRGVDKQAIDAALDAFMAHAPNALGKIADGQSGVSVVSPLDQRVLEAIVIADGSRPSFMLEDGNAPLDDPYIGAWQGTIASLEDELRALALAVGRIQPTNGHSGRYIGTGVLVDAKAGMVLTNYHVLDDALKKFLVPMLRIDATTVRVLAGLEIDFIGEATSLKRNAFRVVEAKLHPRSGRGFGRFDAVTLKIEAASSESVLPSKAVAFSADASTFNIASEKSLCTIGFPGPPETSSDPSGRIDWRFVTQTLFDDRFGVKRLAPGRVNRPPGTVEEDRHWTFGHEATTFGGASGSPVFAWTAAGQPAIGLHYGGDTEIANYALTTALVSNEMRAIGVPL